MSEYHYTHNDIESVVEAIPSYRKIYYALRNDIIARKFLPNEKLPSEVELCKTYGVSRHTIRHAFQMLVTEGLVIRKQGQASFVRPLLGAQNNEETIVLHLGCLNQPAVLLTQFLQRFARRVEELTSGLVKIQIHHSSEFGSGSEQVQKVADASLDMFGGAIDWLAMLDSSFAVSTFPFLFRDVEHVQRVVSHPLMLAKRDELVDTQGVRVIAGNWFRPSRIVISREPCLSSYDLEGLRIGIPSIPLYHQLWSALGMHPVDVKWGERKEALQEGRIDATDVNWDIILSENLCEEAPYALCTKHLYSRVGIIISEAKFQSFRRDIRDFICQAAEEVGTEYTNYLLAQYMDDKKAMIARNMRFIEADTTPLHRKTEALFKKLAAENEWPVSLYEKIKAL